MTSPPNIAVFCDYENVAIGAAEVGLPTFSVQPVLHRALERGKVLVKRAYADWSRYQSAKRPMHEAGFELIEIPHTRYAGKNSADIRLVVDALDMAHTKRHIDTFVVVSGDSDFTPLVSKLRENGKVVLGIGVEKSTSSLLVESCDEFVFYDELILPSLTEAPPEPLARLLETVVAIDRDRDGPLWGSMVKQAMRRKQPGFSERRFGYSNFNALLEAAREHGLLQLESDERSGGYRIVGHTHPQAPARGGSPG